MNVQPVILCGGSGTRLWPLSRENHPKQLLALDGDHTMLQATALRLGGAGSRNGSVALAPIVVSNEEYRFISAEQLRQVNVKPEALVLEPFGRNTAPALTLAALYARSKPSDPVFVVMPADHVVRNTEAFREATCLGLKYAERGQFVTFGVKPLMPHTGYGYIRASDAQPGRASPVVEFVEKPDADTARRYVASGDYFWNSGVFMMKSSSWLREISRWRPDIARACEAAVATAEVDQDFVRVNREAFAACPSESIDCAVMEPLATQNAGEAQAVVIPLHAEWSDIGAWSAIWDIGVKDARGNAIQGDVRTVGTHESLIIAESRLVACVGLSGAVVVETPDAVLVADRSRIEQLKELVAALKAEGRPELAAHRKVHRPWGWYDSIDAGPRFQVKRIVVYPGAALSLQLHHHRAEHWVVVTGTARVTRDGEVFVISENQSTYIPLGVKHRLENPGKVPLEIIEVQSGTYLGEDDIVRFDDSYGRH